MSLGKSALLLGATGQTGRHLLRTLLASPYWTRVGEYGRRLTDPKSLEGAEKLEQKTIDFENLSESGLKDGKWDVVFIVMGTTKAIAGSAEAFEKIDRQYVINAAKEAKSSDPAVEQRLVYLSAIGANPKSSLLYPRNKGLTERGLANLGYQETIVFRPAFLIGTDRKDSRLAETAATWVTGALSYISDSMQIKVAILAKAIAASGQLGVSALPPSAKAFKDGQEGSTYTVIQNSGALALAEHNL
ncbi:hypothetical protein C8J56DRAFT_971624 [Mycena floridula]|nr:hypothetical protein C8J56DRAFT_971624 [Mycena floridula]